jgi:D-alanyl-D-alanine carboxypeptidase (penicillin-binding protein 5/6)
MRGKLGFICVGLFLVPFFLLPAVVEASGLRISSRSGILMETPSGKVLWEQNADLPIPPASVTKIISLYLVFEAIESGRAHLNDQVQISSLAASTGGSRMGLRAGTTVPLCEIMKGMAVASGNDACVAAAEHLYGSVDEFVRHMNEKASALGMTNTVFMNPNGLPAKGQVTTARDMAKLSLAYLKRFPSSLDMHSMRSYTYNNAPHRNVNRLLGVCPGVDGIKTGWVVASGYNLSATAKRGNTRILAVVLGAPNPGTRTLDAAKMLEEGFAMLAPYDPGITVASTEDIERLYCPAPPVKAAKQKQVTTARVRAKKALPAKTTVSSTSKTTKAKAKATTSIASSQPKPSAPSGKTSGAVKSTKKQTVAATTTNNSKTKVVTSKTSKAAPATAVANSQDLKDKEKKVSTKAALEAKKKAAM